MCCFYYHYSETKKEGDRAGLGLVTCHTWMLLFVTAWKLFFVTGYMSADLTIEEMHKSMCGHFRKKNQLLSEAACSCRLKPGSSGSLH